MTIPIIICVTVAIIFFAYFKLIGSFHQPIPRITTLERPLKVVGVSMRTTQKSISKDVIVLGKKYKKVKDSGVIKNQEIPWKFVAISKDFEGSDSWEHLMGDVVTSFNDQSEKLVSFEIPSKKYAIFTIKPKSKFAWGISIGRMKRYIYTDWIKNSDYELDSDILGDFELHDERSEMENPEIDLYISIKKKVAK
jgi:predicted transcriptional regulator YdeE